MSKVPVALCGSIGVVKDMGIPDLPMAKYSVWVRGYGLVDSPRVPGTPGTALDLTAVAAPNARAAAEYYPAGYWLSLLHVPEKKEFPGTGENGNTLRFGIWHETHFSFVFTGHTLEITGSTRFTAIGSSTMGPAGLWQERQIDS